MKGEYMELINSNKKLQELKQSNEMLLIYFGNNICNVCVSIKPKLEKLLEKYDKIKAVHIDVEKSADIAAQHNIFTIPAILVFVDGKESIREARFISIDNLSDKLSRYYDMIF